MTDCKGVSCGQLGKKANTDFLSRCFTLEGSRVAQQEAALTSQLNL